MQEREPQYFKFVTALIDSGKWATMTPAARALYPVLLRFSDRHYREVWPGTQTLLKLTGFKQKASLRKARQELVELGLVTVAPGGGRKNSRYHFHFDWVTAAPRSGTQESPGAGRPVTPAGGTPPLGEGGDSTPPYNQIHISINNHADSGGAQAESLKDGGKQAGKEPSGLALLRERFGADSVRLALSECRLAGLPASAENVQKILYRGERPQGESWADVEEFLASRISPGSLEMIRESLLEERDGVLVFRDSLPEYLKQLLRHFDHKLFFEPRSATSRRDFWRPAAPGGL